MNTKVYELLDRLRTLEETEAKIKQELKELLSQNLYEEAPYKYVVGRVYPSGKRDGKSAWIEAEAKNPGKHLVRMDSFGGIVVEVGLSRKAAEARLEEYLGISNPPSDGMVDPKVTGYPNKPLYKY